MEFLISKKANVDYLDAKGNSALDLITKFFFSTNSSTVRLLLDQGASVYQRTNLYAFLKREHPTHANVYACYSHLINHLKTPQIQDDHDLKKEVKASFDYLANLKKDQDVRYFNALMSALTVEKKEETITKVKGIQGFFGKTTTIVTVKKLPIFPPPILRLIIDYTHSLEVFGVFRPDKAKLQKTPQQENSNVARHG